MDSRRRSYSGSNKRVSRKQNKRGYREFKRNAWSPQLSIAGQGQINRRDGIPPSMLQKLRYAGVSQIATPASSYGENGVSITLDPFGIGTAGLPVTHQPSLFDQFMTLYNNYRVRAYKVRITANASPPSVSTASATWFGSVILAPGVSGAAVTSYLALAADPRAKSGLCHRSDAGITVHKHYYSLQALAGNVDPTDDAYTGSSSASPPLITNLQLVAKSDVGTNISTVYFQVDVKFYVEFFNPLSVAVS